MDSTEIDGVAVSGSRPLFGLSVSDILRGGMLTDRLASILAMSAECGHLAFVCIRNDSRDPQMFCEAAIVAGACGMPLILESADPLCLREAVGALDGRTPLLCVTDPARLRETALLSAVTGCPVAVPGDDVESLMANAESLDGLDLHMVLSPMAVSMKACLETFTDLHRLASEHGVPQASHPSMVRTWSGEYALSVSSVAAMRGCALAVLDDLDPEGCRVLDGLMDAFSM